MNKKFIFEEAMIKKTKIKKSKMITAILVSALALLCTVSRAELQDLNSDEMQLVNGQDGIALKLDLGLGSDPLTLVSVTDASDTVNYDDGFDPASYANGEKLRPIGLGVTTGSGVNDTTTVENSRRFALRYPKDGTEPPFFLLLDNFEIAISLEQVNINLEEIQGVDSGGNPVSANAIQLSFPGLVDIKKLSIDAIHIVPQAGTEINGELVGDLGLNEDGSNLGSFDTEHTFCTAADPECGDGIVFLAGLDADITLQIDGRINIFPAGTKNDGFFGDAHAADISGAADLVDIYQNVGDDSLVYDDGSQAGDASFRLYSSNAIRPVINSGQGYIR